VQFDKRAQTVASDVPRFNALVQAHGLPAISCSAVSSS
jgi:hypothetical protein